MAHFAQINADGIVERVVVISNDDIIDADGNENEQIGQVLCAQIVGPGNWVQTSYNGNFRYNYGGVGYHYDATAEAFYEPQPFNSWTLDTATYQWVAPVPYPDDGGDYRWNEQTQSWEQL